MQSVTSTISYRGNLRTNATHRNSGETILTDAPLDNNGKGNYFSPTDLVATALGSCMLTLMGIAAEKHDFRFDQAEVEITKIMASNPRRIAEIIVNFKIPSKDLNERQKKILEKAAIECPVAKSLHTDILQSVTFEYE